MNKKLFQDAIVSSALVVMNFWPVTADSIWTFKTWSIGKKYQEETIPQ